MRNLKLQTGDVWYQTALSQYIWFFLSWGWGGTRCQIRLKIDYSKTDPWSNFSNLHRPIDINPNSLPHCRTNYVMEVKENIMYGSERNY